MIRWRQVRSGQTLVLAALSMVVMVGFVALAVDVGLLLTIKRRMQTAADAGAIAAATALRTGGDFGQITQAADGIASLNGFSAVDVTVYSPPEHGDPAYVGNAGYVEVDVAKAEPTYFLRALGYRSIDVSAKAISGAEPAPVCVYALDRLVAGAMKVTGNGTSVKVACGVMDDSDSADALDSSEGAGLSAASIGVSGSYNPGTFVPTPITGVAPIADPLASLPAPPATACNRETVTDSGGYPASGSQPANGSSFEVPAKVYRKGISLDGSFRAVTFQQGTYGNGITISGDIGTTTFNPGQYQSAAGQDSIDISGSTNAIFTPGDYTFCGSVSFTGNDTLTLSPGTYEGGIRIGGNVRSVTFSPGTYIINGGGFSVTGG
ncbi:MAG: pilus assembly protein TadG-related protein, partial [Candidatus Binataceae bacterium]